MANKKNNGNDLDMLLREMVTEGLQRSKFEMDVIQFADEILGVELWPTQRAVLKALYNLPLTRGLWRDIFKGSDERRESLCRRFDQDPDSVWDEREILETWAIEGKTTWIEGQTYTELVLECGMRGTKTSMISIPILYEYWKCSQMDDPADSFGLLKGSLIAFLVLATSEEQAQDTLFAAIKGRIQASPYFQGLISTGQLIVNNLEILSPGKNLKMWAGHSRCLPGDTLIATTKGMKRIDALVPSSQTGSVLDVDFEVPTTSGTQRVEKAIFTGRKKTLKIETRWGYQVEGSENHPLLVMQENGVLGWKTLDSLREGDFLALKRGWSGGEGLLISPEWPFGYQHHYGPGTSNQNDFQTPVRMTPDLARFMGYLTGDGCVTIVDRIGFKSMDQELIDDFHAICRDLFKTEPIESTRQENNQSRMFWAYNKKLKGFLEWLGMEQVKAPEKRVPWSIWQSTPACQAAYLRGLFDTDGHASSQDKAVGLSSTSKKLIEDAQLLLLKLGIVSQKILSSKAQGPRTYHDKVIDNKHDVWALQVRGPEVDKFMATVGFGLSRKTNAVPDRNFKVTNDVIPHVHKIVQQMREIELSQRGWREKTAPERLEAWHLVRKTVFNSHAPGRDDHGGMSEMKLDRVIEYFEPVPGVEGWLHQLKELRSMGLFFDPIVSIEMGEADLYDFQVPEEEHFFANGFMSHNSAGLVGRTLMVFAMDEGNRFGIEASGGATGVEMYANVGKGVTTLSRFGSKKIVISSAWCEGDLTETLYEQASTGGDHILAFRLATWDMNPEFNRLKEDHPHIQAEYKTRGIEAMRDYAGIRPGVDELFFNRHAVSKVMKHEQQIGYEVQKDGRKVVGKDGTTRTYAAVNIIIPKGITIPMSMFSYGHCDPGLKKDSFGFVAGNPLFDKTSGQLVVDITTLVEWEPIDKGHGNVWMVDYENVEKELLRLADPIRLKRLTFDHWNSAHMIQRLYSKGVSTYEFKSSFSQTVQREIYTTLREWINAERVRLPHPSSSAAATKLHKELIELRLMNGRRIDHPKPKGSKDLSDCLACVVWAIAQEERRFRFPEIGDNKMRVMGQIHSAGAIEELFHDGKMAASRSHALRNSAPAPGTMARKTLVSQKDW